MFIIYDLFDCHRILLRLNKENEFYSIFAAPKFDYSEIIRKFATDNK